MTGDWRWPDPEAIPGADEPHRLAAATLQRLVAQLEARLVGEQMAPRTWQRCWAPYLTRLVAAAGERQWAEDAALLERHLRQ